VDAHAFLLGVDNIHEAVNQIVSEMLPSGKPDAMTMITTDDMLLTTRVNLHHAYAALLDNNVLGLSLHTDAIACKERQTSRIFVSKGEEELPVWLWPGAPGPLGDAFSFGTVYRTGDLLGPLFQNKWDSPESLRTMLNADETLRRRTKMACLPAPVMVHTFP
jgi:hypothetical protein